MQFLSGDGIYAVIIVLVVIILLLALHCGLLYSMLKKKDEPSEEDEKQAKNTTEDRPVKKYGEISESEFLLSQVKPHFIFNALATIQYLYESNNSEASTLMHAFCKYLRNALDFDHQKELTSFDEDIEHLESYTTIEKVRFPNIDVIYIFDVTDFQIPFYTVQPLVENAIKHGIRPTGNGGMVTVSTLDTENSVVVMISDNGVGFDPDIPPKNDGKSHLGIPFTRSRIEKLCGGTMTIKSKVGDGTTVTITLPKNKV